MWLHFYLFVNFQEIFLSFLVYYGQIRHFDFNVNLLICFFEHTGALALWISAWVWEEYIFLYCWEEMQHQWVISVRFMFCLCLLFPYGLFCQEVLSITASGALKSPTISVLLFMSPFGSTNIYFINLGVLMCVYLYLLHLLYGLILLLCNFPPSHVAHSDWESIFSYITIFIPSLNKK